MLNFDWFDRLDLHQRYLQKKCKTDDIFLVGWCVRDFILNTEKTLKDIDFTMAWLPTEIYEQIDKKDLSHFITEKFGTITLIPKWHKVQYELTPLRTENSYSDNRHPEEIQRQDDIILDSNRRDFTINSLYYFSTNLDKKHFILSDKLNKKQITNITDIQKSLEKYWILFYQDQNLLLIQDHKYIQKLFDKWHFNSDFAVYLLDMLKEVFVSTKKSKDSTIRIVVDLHKGIQDIIRRNIKCVLDPDNRFTEDALRTIRALRFVSVLNQKLKESSHKLNRSKSKINSNIDNKIKLFDIESSTRTSLKKHVDLVRNVAKERIKDEMMKVFSVWDPFAFISLLDETKLLEYIFPWLYKTKNIEQPVRYHPFDTYVHTLLTLYELQKINTDYLVRFSMLYHDVGKVWQYQSYQNGLSREEIREILAWPLNHRNSGPEIAKEDFSKLWFSKNEIYYAIYCQSSCSMRDFGRQRWQ